MKREGKEGERERERETRERERLRERIGERDADSQRSICVEKGGARYGNRC